MAAKLTWKKLPNSTNFQRTIVIPFKNLFLPKKDCGKYLKKHTNFGASYPLRSQSRPMRLVEDLLAKAFQHLRLPFILKAPNKLCFMNNVQQQENNFC